MLSHDVADGVFGFAALGGSNTLGAKHIIPGKGGHGSWTSFARLTYLSLRTANRTDEYHSGAIGAMGPTLSAACTGRFIPLDSRYVTIEYMPNMGYIDDDKGEIAAIERLLIASHNRSARAFVVNVLPSQNMSRFAQCRDGAVGCTTRAHMMRLHAAISALALAYHAPLITADCDETPHLFGGDLMHLNQEGHDAVHRRIMGALRKWPYEPLTTLPRSSRHAAAELAVGCWFGAELEQIIGRADGFDRVDFSDARSARSDKIGWQSANASGAELTMCLDLPDPPSGSQRAKPNGKPARLYLASVGLQMSHPKNLPLFGVATISCSGPCTCACFTSEHGRFNTSCMFDGLVPRSSATVTAWARLDIRPKEAAEEAAKKAGGAADSEEQLALPHPEAATCAPQKCALRVRNTADPGETRRRVLVRALILGIRDHYRTKFMNMYHMRHAGMNDARRRLLAVEPAPPQPSLALGTA